MFFGAKLKQDIVSPHISIIFLQLKLSVVALNQISLETHWNGDKHLVQQLLCWKSDFFTWDRKCPVFPKLSLSALLSVLFCFFPYMASALLWWEKYVLDGQHLRISAIRKSLLWMCTAETFLKTYLAACISLFKWEGKGKDAAWGSSLFFFFLILLKNKHTNQSILWPGWLQTDDLSWFSQESKAFVYVLLSVFSCIYPPPVHSSKLYVQCVWNIQGLICYS